VRSKAADASKAGIIVEHRIESVMTRQVVTARPSTSFRELVDLLQRNRISALPVVDQDGRLVGIVSEADLLIKQGYPHGGADAGVIDAVRHRARLEKAAGICALDVMTRRVVTVPLGTEVATAARLMIRLGIKRLPVVDDQERLVGIATRGDLLKVFLRPDQAMVWEVAQEIVQARMGIPAGTIDVQGRDGTVSLTGHVQRRSQLTELMRLVQAVNGVISVDARVTWDIDDETAMAAWPIA
jgi:CBS domain-containing protein